MSPKDDKPELPNAKPPVVDTPAATPAVELPAVAKTPAAAAETKTPAEWAASFGHTKPRDARLPQSTEHVDPKYAVADKLYGWSERAYHYQAPEDAFRITTNTYLEALRSAYQFPAAELTVAALTPEAAEQHRDFKPARNLKVERAAKEAKKSQVAKAAAAAESKKDPA